MVFYALLLVGMFAGGGESKQLNQSVELLVDWKLALSLSPASVADATRSAFSFCQRALTQGQVVPRRTLGNLSQGDNRRWRVFGCLHQFCFNATAASNQRPPPPTDSNKDRMDPDAVSAIKSFHLHKKMQYARRMRMRSTQSRRLSTQEEEERVAKRRADDLAKMRLDPRFCEWTTYGKALVKKYSNRVNERCARKRNAVTILTTLPRIPVDFGCFNPLTDVKCYHMVENLLSLGENSRDINVKEIRVLVDVVDGKEDPSEQIRRAVQLAQIHYNNFIDSASTPYDLRKITVEVVGQQPSYPDMFRYSSTHLRGLVALANADIVFRGFDRLDTNAFEYRDDNATLALALSVAKPTGKYAREFCEEDSDVMNGHCELWSKNYGVSWDSFVFKSPLSNHGLVQSEDGEDLVDYSIITPPPGSPPAFMNALHAEGCAANFLMQNGYRLYNPCKTIVAEHWHCMGTKMHSVSKNQEWIKLCSSRMNFYGQVGGPGTMC